MKKEKIFGIVLIVIIFIILFIIITHTPIINKFRNNGKLIINEIMAANSNTITDITGNTSDYIEIYNGYDYEINLNGYYLSDDNFNTKKWKFPDVTIKEKEYLIIFASGLDKKEGELHTNFKLNDSGEVVTLSDPSGKSLSKIYYVKTSPDTTYGYKDNSYVYFYEGTPGYQNIGDFSKEPITTLKKDTNIHITEYMTNNISSYKSKDNKYYSLIEIYNDNEYDVNLEGFYLSNKIDNPYKYKLPEKIIKAKSYIVIFASGLDKKEDEIHTNFSLNSNDNVLILSDKYKNEIDKVYLTKLDANNSFGYYENEWHHYDKHSIGYENDINYQITCNIKGEVNGTCKINGTDSNVYEGTLTSYEGCVNLKDEVDVSSYNKETCNNNGYSFRVKETVANNYFEVISNDENELNNITVEIIVTSTKPYTRTLTNEFILSRSLDETGSLNLIYNEYDEYSRLIISNTYNEKKCIKLSFDSSKLKIDNDSSVLNYNVDNKGYINNATIEINNNSNKDYLFYRINENEKFTEEDFSIIETECQ